MPLNCTHSNAHIIVYVNLASVFLLNAGGMESGPENKGDLRGPLREQQMEETHSAPTSCVAGASHPHTGASVSPLCDGKGSPQPALSKHYQDARCCCGWSVLIVWIHTFFSIDLLLRASRLLSQLASSIVANFQDKTQCPRGQRACCYDKCCVWKREAKTEQSRRPVSWGAEDTEAPGQGC